MEKNIFQKYNHLNNKVNKQKIAPLTPMVFKAEDLPLKAPEAVKDLDDDVGN